MAVTERKGAVRQEPSKSLGEQGLAVFPSCFPAALTGSLSPSGLWMGNWLKLVAVFGGGQGLVSGARILLPRLQEVAILATVVLLQSHKKEDLYSILWMLVFGFATLNILGLVAKRLEPQARRGAGFGEILAVLVLCTSFALLGWELLNLFHIFPIKLRAR